MSSSLIRISHETPLGAVEILGTESAIVALYFPEGSKLTTSLARLRADAQCDGYEPECINNCRRELDEYFCGQRRSFTVPLAPVGTPFEQKIWATLQTIPFGVTVAYSELTEAATMSPLTVRAVAAANGKNPISIIIPCHRVIGKNGNLTGYAGGLHRKEWLLRLEQKPRQPSFF